MYWFFGIGIFFFIISISLLFEDLSTGLLGIVIGIALIAIGVFLLKKQKPQFFHFLTQKNYRAALKSLSKSYDSTQAAYADIDRQITQKDAEHTIVNELPDLTPTVFNGYPRKYHYKDVNVRVRWEYGGHYGKSCESIGIKRGDSLQLLPPKDNDREPGSVAICWNGLELGYMKSNRMRDMVHSWNAANLPVLATVSFVGGEEKLLAEFSFYGAPPRHN